MLDTMHSWIFPKDKLRPNSECESNWCRQRQKEYKEKLIKEPKVVVVQEQKKVVHEENEWGISLASDDNDDQVQHIESIHHTIPVGTERELPSAAHQQISEKEKVHVDDNVGLEDLMANLKSLSTKK